MSELYTSLTQLKMAMNGGVLPPMTPITGDALKYINPAFTISPEAGGGMGALFEDERGLRCPYRGCGEFKHHLTHHANQRHRVTGGAAAIKRWLGLPSNVALVSSPLKMRLHLAGKERQRMRDPAISRACLEKMWRSKRRSGGALIRRNKHTAGNLNFKDVCAAQTTQRILRLQYKLGHSPSQTEAGREYGTAWVTECRRAWGSWNNAKRVLGLETRARGDAKLKPGQDRYDRDTIYDALRGFHEVHGRLPTSCEAIDPDRAPLFPCYITIREVLGLDSWASVCSHVSFILGIDDLGAEAELAGVSLPGDTRHE